MYYHGIIWKKNLVFYNSDIRAHAIRRGNQYLFDIVTVWKMIGYNNKAISG